MPIFKNDNAYFIFSEYIANNFLGMSSEFGNEIENYRSIVQENGAISALIKLVEDSSTKSEIIRNRVLDPSITENVSERN